MNIINILHGNIIKYFEQTNEFSLQLHQQSVRNGKVNPCIVFNEEEVGIKFPFVEIASKQINLHETHLAHLWSFIYSLFVIYEESIQKPMLENIFDGRIVFNTPLLQRAEKLFVWSLNLNKSYSPWNLDLPNPKEHLDEKEKFYAEKANNLYQNSVAFLLYHELSHLINDHTEFYVHKSDIDNVLLIELEREADEFAFSQLVREDDEQSKIIKGLAIMMVMLSSLMLSKLDGLIQIEHPDIDQRLINIINKLNFEDEKNEFYIWYLGCYGLNIFLAKEGITIDPPLCDNHRQLFFLYLDTLDQKKAKFIK